MALNEELWRHRAFEYESILAGELIIDVLPDGTERYTYWYYRPDWDDWLLIKSLGLDKDYFDDAPE